MTKYHIKNCLSNVNHAWYIILLSGLNLLLMQYYIYLTNYMEIGVDITMLFDDFAGIVLDVSILLMFTYIITWRKNKVALLCLFLTTLIWSFSNVMYSRFFHHYLTLSAIGQGGVLTDSLIIDCIVNNFKWMDLYYILACIIFIIVWHRPKLDNGNSFVIRRLFLMTLFLIMLSPCIHATYCAFDERFRYITYYFHRLYSHQITTYRTLSQPNFTNFVRGSIRNLCAEFYLDIQGNIELNDEQLRIIATEINESKRTVTNCNIAKKNLVFILVESYMSFTSDMTVDGKEVTPFLNALKRDSTVYFNGKMHENVTNGESSDGQFIYMTGLLPLRSIVTVSKARKIAQPALPKFLHKESRMILPTPSSVWNQDEMCQQYGFDSLFASNSYADGTISGLTDEQVFQLAEQYDNTSHHPFFSVVLTMSMHQPYLKQIDPSFPIKDKSISDELACYLNVCHYTDQQIGKYLNHLKRIGLYDNSIIVIAADHPVHTTDFGGRQKDIPLYFVNVPNDIRKHMWKGECNQVDVFTTILDLFGVKSNWYGLGKYLLSPNYKNEISSRKWDASEWIIRGNYFLNL